jgi:hypothetical protein
VFYFLHFSIKIPYAFFFFNLRTTRETSFIVRGLILQLSYMQLRIVQLFHAPVGAGSKVRVGVLTPPWDI